MKRITPDTFNGPRAYFTAFDRRIISRASNVNLLRKTVERKIKLLLLLKSTVVCAASHLKSAFAYDFFREHPVLLRDGHIVPALRSDKESILEVFEEDSLEVGGEAAKFFEENTHTAVSWQLEDNSKWFKERFLSELIDENSLVRGQMTGVSELDITGIVNELQSVDVLGRKDVENAAKGLPSDAKTVLLNFRELAYHMSGARVVNSESCLPQENYIDYDLADLKQKRSRLSEDQILWKLFIETALDSVERPMLPVELLDILSFEDILAIRRPILESKFQERYDQLVRSAVAGAPRDGNEELLSFSELEEIREELRQTFDAVFQEELPVFLRKRLGGNVKELGSVSFSVALGLLGLIPGIGTLSSGVSVLKDSPALLFNIQEVFTSSKALSNLQEYFNQRDQVLKRQIDKSDISEKATMLEMVDVFTSTLSEKIKI